jgi:hypothetical protein
LSGPLKRSTFLGQNETNAPFLRLLPPGSTPNQGAVSKRLWSLTAFFRDAPKSGQIEIDAGEVLNKFGDLLNRAVFVAFTRNSLTLFLDAKN